MTAKTADLELPGGLDHSRMQNLLGYNIAQASIPSSKVFQRSIGRPFEISQVEFTILVLLHSNPGATGKQLCESLGAPAARMSLLLDRLSGRGWIVKTQSGQDKRLQHLQLSAEGEALVLKSLDVASTMENDLLSHLTKIEQVVLMELLRKVAARRKA